MAACEDHLLVLHADDGQAWAKFLSTRMSNQQYGIHCVLKNLAQTQSAPGDAPPPPPPRTTPRRPSLSSLSSSGRGDSSTQDVAGDDIYMNSGHDSNNNDRARGKKDAPTPQKVSLEESISNSKATVVLLSPDIVQDDVPFSVEVTSLMPKTTVFLLLGVEVEDARSYFGDKSDHVFKCRISVIDGTETTVVDALFQIIQAYEYLEAGLDGEEEEEGGEDIYQIAPSPVQANRVEKVFPQRLSLDEREVYVLLARPSEDSVLVVLEDMSREITLTQVCDRLYCFTLPSTVEGKIHFHVECSGHTVGAATVRVSTPLDQIREVLAREVTPLAVLSTALGLPAGDIGGVDTALAFKLQELAPAITFAKMFPCEESLSNNFSDVRSSHMWPSLLHFAADFNLRTLCSELLRYPGMLGAALTENREGLYPCQMAAKKGFNLLEHDLLKYVESRKSECYDSDGSDYVLPQPLMHPATAHGAAKSKDYVNAQDDGQVYVQMDSARQPFLDLQHQTSEASVARSVSQQGSDSVFSSRGSQGDDSSQDVYINLDEIQSNTLPPQRAVSSRIPSDKASSPSQSPRDLGGSLTLDRSDSPTSRKALKMLGVREDDILRSKSVSVEQILDMDMPPYLAAFPPGVKIPSLLSQDTASRESVSSQCDDPEAYQTRREPKPNVMRHKLRSFLSKIKGGGKRNNSEGDLSQGINSLKKSTSMSSQHSSGSGRSEGRLATNKKSKSFSCDDVQERDSGSYSDEEKSKVPPRKPKQKVFKESEKGMNRRISRRAQQARRERISDAPSLPKQERSKAGAFKSFI